MAEEYYTSLLSNGVDDMTGWSSSSASSKTSTANSLRRDIIERTLTFIEEQVKATFVEEIWDTPGAWQIWIEQIGRLEKAMTAEERADYAQRLANLRARIHWRYVGAPHGKAAPLSHAQVAALEQNQAAILRALNELSKSQPDASASIWPWVAVTLSATVLLLLLLLLLEFFG